MLFSKQLAENKERIAALEGQISALTGEKAALSASLETANAELANLRASQDTFTAQLSEANAKAEKAGKELALANSTIEASDKRIAELEASQTEFNSKVSAEAARLLAASGHTPLNIGVDTDNQATGEKPKNPDVKGLDRTRAAFASQFKKS